MSKSKRSQAPVIVLEPPRETVQIAVRVATISDVEFLKATYLLMLQELQQYGHDVLPTAKNAEAFTGVFVRPSLDGEQKTSAILIAEDNGVPVGVIYWVGNNGIFDIGPQAFGHGTYVFPNWRLRHVASGLRKAASARLKALGFEKIVGTISVKNLPSFRALKDWNVTGHIIEQPL